MEHVQDTHRLALMNLMLHGIDSDPERLGGIRYGDTLCPEGQALPKATLILTNPPFGTKKGGGLPSRTDFTFPTSNKQFCFLQHIYRGLKPGGRAAVVLPDNVLFESGIGRQIRADLMDKCNLHTILRLPTGIFYAQGVKTNVLFFTRGEENRSDKGNTKEVWVYDLRANMPQFGKRTVLTREHFAEFEAAFGDDPLGGPEAWPSARTPARPAASAASPASGSPSAATASTSPGSRTRTATTATSCQSRRCWPRRRWASLKGRWRSCGESWRSWERRQRRKRFDYGRLAARVVGRMHARRCGSLRFDSEGRALQPWPLQRPERRRDAGASAFAPTLERGSQTQGCGRGHGAAERSAPWRWCALAGV